MPVVTLAIASQKGGVGKTTLCVNLAYAMASRGWHTLLLDTDPQGSVGLSLSRKAQDRCGFYDAVHSDLRVDELVQPTRLPELQILTSGQNVSFFDSALDPDRADSEVKEIFRVLGQRGYDLIIADTPAGLSGYTGQILKCADFVVVPQQAEPLGARSIPHVLGALKQLHNEGHKVKLLGILLTMMQNDSEACQSVVEELREILPGDYLLRDVIPRDAEFLEASAKGVPLALLRENPPSSAIVFEKLAADLERRMSLRKQEDGTEEQAHTPLMD